MLSDLRLGAQGTLLSREAGTISLDSFAWAWLGSDTTAASNSTIHSYQYRPDTAPQLLLTSWMARHHTCQYGIGVVKSLEGATDGAKPTGDLDGSESPALATACGIRRCLFLYLLSHERRQHVVVEPPELPVPFLAGGEGCLLVLVVFALLLVSAPYPRHPNAVSSPHPQLAASPSALAVQLPWRLQRVAPQ